MYSTAFKTLAILVVVTIQIHFTATKHQDEILYGFKYGDGEDSSAFTIDLPKGWAPWVKYIQLGKEEITGGVPSSSANTISPIFTKCS